MKRAKKFPLNEKNILWLLAFALITFILWQIPSGRYILYPFTILGTWFHEMGHGLAAMILGGSFHRLELYSNGSGLAVHSGAVFFGSVGNALIAAAGPVGPTVAGALFIISSKNVKTTRLALLLLSFLLLISPIIWIRSLFGFIIIFIYGLLCLVIAVKAPDRWKKLTIQLLGVQACLSVYLGVGYLFSQGASVGGRAYISDTAQIQNNFFLPYWFWGGLILLFSILVISLSVRYLYKSSNQKIS